MQLAKFIVPGVIPDIDHPTVVHVPENFFATVIEAAQRNVAIDQDGHRPPQAIAWLANALLFCITEGATPVMDAGEVDMVHHVFEHLFGLFTIRRLASCRDDDRRRFSRFISQFSKRLDVVDNLGMVEPNTQKIELFGIGTIDADFDLIESAIEDALCEITAEQVSISKDLDLGDPFFFAVTDAIGKLFIDQWLAVPVQMYQSHSTFDTLFDHSLEEVLFHVPFATADGRAWAEDAVGLAVIGGLDSDCFGERLPQQAHRIGDNVRRHRAHGSNKRLPEC